MIMTHVSKVKYNVYEIQEAGVKADSYEQGLLRRASYLDFVFDALDGDNDAPRSSTSALSKIREVG